MFASVQLARRAERAEVELITAAAEAARRRTGGRAGEFVIALAGGVASFAGPGSPFTKVTGLGFDEGPSEADLDRIDDAYAAVGGEVQVEIASLADPQVFSLLSQRGFQLRSFENVLGCDLSTLPAPVPNAEVHVSVSPADELDLWLDVVVEGGSNPDQQGVAAHEHFDRTDLFNAERDLAGAGLHRYLARLDGIAAGGAGLRIASRVAQFAGAATLPAYRRRGVQSALLSTRLADAAAAGCDIAVITVQPGSKSQENAQRRGFELLYTRAVLARP